jgi:hypothetical protein
VFGSARGAVETLRLHAEIGFVDTPIETVPADTRRAAEAMRREGCAALIVLGGDGTNRLVASAWPDAPLVPISTGTNNAFPGRLEAASAGAAAGLVASGAVRLDEVAHRAKRIEATFEDGSTDLALVDAVLLEGDHPGSLLHFEPAQLRQVVLTRADPAGVGTSPLGGLLHPTGAGDDRGVLVRCTAPGGGGQPLLVHVSPGVYRHAFVADSRPLGLGEAVLMVGPGVVAFDGDRQRRLEPGEVLRLRVLRDGPHVIDVDRALLLAAERGVFRDRPHGHDAAGTGGFDCC